MVTAYASTEEYKAAVGVTDPGENMDISESLEAMSDYIDKLMGFTFGRDTAPVERFFRFKHDAYGRRPTSISLPPIATATGLVIKTDDNGDGTAEVTWDNSDVELQPLNAVVLGEPFTSIAIPSWSSLGSWPAETLVSITAVWGYPFVPAGVKRECIRLTSIARLQSGWATLRVDDLGSPQLISREARQVAQDLLRVYHPTGGIGVA